MTERVETKTLDLLESYRQRLDSFREKLAWVKDYL